MASRDKVDVDMFHKSIQYALEKLGKSKSGFERTVVSKFKRKRRVGSGNELVDYSTTSSPEFSGSAVVGSPGRPLGTRKKYEFFDWLSVKQSLDGSRSYRKSSKKDIYFHWLWLISGSQQKRKEKVKCFGGRFEFFPFCTSCHV